LNFFFFYLRLCVCMCVCVCVHPDAEQLRWLRSDVVYLACILEDEGGEVGRVVVLDGG
jgi:hypothetical protein